MGETVWGCHSLSRDPCKLGGWILVGGVEVTLMSHPATNLVSDTLETHWSFPAIFRCDKVTPRLSDRGDGDSLCGIISAASFSPTSLGHVGGSRMVSLGLGSDPAGMPSRVHRVHFKSHRSLKGLGSMAHGDLALLFRLSHRFLEISANCLEHTCCNV